MYEQERQMKERILVVDDEPDLLRLLTRTLPRDLDCDVLTASSGEQAMQRLRAEPVDLVLLDMKMPGMDGLDVLDRIRAEHPWLTVIMMTAHGCIELAVQAMRQGAYDFLTKPFDHDALAFTIGKALERSRLIRENLHLQRRLKGEKSFQNIVGKSPAMQRVFDALQMVADSDLTVLITGESGTGKDLVARAIHNLSGRKTGPFVAVNCPTVPENILESELFGYRKGAFTHATQNKMGLFQEAHGGTLFLDEIGDISPSIQTKLLRVLQEKTIKPLGDTKDIRVDVRVVASTNRNLLEKMRTGEFREDLYYRLNVVPIEMPPLRERREDIPLLVDHFLQIHGRQLNRPSKSVSPQLMDLFLRHDWEGNVRELENTIMRGILFAPGEEILPEHVGFSDASPSHDLLHDQHLHELPYREAKEEVLRRFNTAYIERLLAMTEGNVTRAAQLCGLERQALQQVMRRFKIKADKFRSHKKKNQETG
ncbi:Response regulator receiver domain-containing protein [Desulfacinum hydrothermale DSM 13146]|uniref:Response regulator receiver domain-containing protein n=2 Tax=Desulfacinum hydrothermale TaxID=109258 RepID=A0A1W1XEQ6_9BACT|nr:Response regulator receiver domain-containing protein [Desulfacinum hydrothermale DSM 13146]